MRCRGLLGAAFAGWATMMAIPAASAPALGLAPALCRNLSAAVGTVPGAGPLFLPSYRPGEDEAEVPLPLRSSAFSYDNALAVMALVACGDLPGARRIGEAFLLALRNDRTFRDGRIRNAYRAGAVTSPVALPGWWDAGAKLWAEDAYQDGTSTGNVAWVALSFLTLESATGDPRYLQDAIRLIGWITDHASEAPGPSGFSGGYHGFDGSQTRLTWKSSEHNVDVVAAATWAARLTGEGRFTKIAGIARGFLDSAFDASAGAFRLGTEPDGRLAEIRKVALDTQLWPLLAVVDAPQTWRRALSYAEARLAVPGGFDFNEDRDGLWVEGTAQAALTYAAIGDQSSSNRLLQGLENHRSASGWLYATREAQITTGLPLGPDSTSEDFLYFRRPHLAATAWAVLAAERWNPFTGRRLP